MAAKTTSRSSVYRIGAICEAVGAPASREGVTFDAEDDRRFNQLIDNSTAAAIEEYATLDRAEQQVENAKRLGFVAHELRNALSVAQLAYTTLKRGIVGVNSRQLGRELESSAVPSRNISLRSEIPDGLTIDGDRRLLRSAAGNVVPNALKLTQDAGTVTIRAYQRDDRVVLEVEDGCGGLAPGSEESLFAAFTQHADDRTGMGLGLPIARDAVEAQGGHINIQNLPGHGCIVRLDLPAVLMGDAHPSD